MSHVTPDEWECALWMMNFEEATMSAVKFIGDGSGGACPHAAVAKCHRNSVKRPRRKPRRRLRQSPIHQCPVFQSTSGQLCSWIPHGLEAAVRTDWRTRCFMPSLPARCEVQPARAIRHAHSNLREADGHNWISMLDGYMQVSESASTQGGSFAAVYIPHVLDQLTLWGYSPVG